LYPGSNNHSRDGYEPEKESADDSASQSACRAGSQGLGGVAADFPAGGSDNRAVEAPGQPIVELRQVTKSFGAVAALKGVDFSVGHREVVGLVGDNGAGKSTLMKILVGALTPDEGELRVDGAKVSFANTRDSRKRGIEMLFQDLALCDDLDVAVNFYLGRAPTQFGFVRIRRMHALARQQLEELGVRLSSTTIPVRFLSGGQRQSLAIARAVSFRPRLLILDEPTAALGVQQSRAVLDLVRQITRSDTSVVFISHRLRDVLDVSDRIVVLYEGRRVANLKSSETTLEEVVTYIVSDPDASQRAARFTAE
jgi:simple sugar transport system ATP-binding protein